MTDEIECPNCEGHGCEACNFTGWSEPTAEEDEALAEAAYDRQFEGEPPLSFRELTEQQAKREADWGVR